MQLIGICFAWSCVSFRSWALVCQGQSTRFKSMAQFVRSLIRHEEVKLFDVALYLSSVPITLQQFLRLGSAKALAPGPPETKSRFCFSSRCGRGWCSLLNFGPRRSTLAALSFQSFILATWVTRPFEICGILVAIPPKALRFQRSDLKCLFPSQLLNSWRDQIRDYHRLEDRLHLSFLRFVCCELEVTVMTSGEMLSYSLRSGSGCSCSEAAWMDQALANSADSWSDDWPRFLILLLDWNQRRQDERYLSWKLQFTSSQIEAHPGGWRQSCRKSCYFLACLSFSTRVSCAPSSSYCAIQIRMGS